MYSGRLVNSSFYQFPGKQTESRFHIDTVLPARECTVSGVGGVLSNRLSDFDLSGREAWMFISIKNRAFDRAYVNRFIEMCELLGIPGHICPVDAPYHYNRMAELGRDDLPREEAAKIERLTSDISRMVQKALNGSRTTRVDHVTWCDLEAETPPLYRAELTAAFNEGKAIRNAIYEQVASVKELEDERTFERFAEFFLCEVPVLMYAYYSKGPTIDVYPGPQPKLLWTIELGLVEDELPRLTALTRSDRAMLYLDTHNRKASGH
jgi:hypothetical protein